MSEDETGLIYMRARHMDPALGRFISEDPAGNGINWYVYCEDNPVGVLDRDGRVAGVDQFLDLVNAGQLGVDIAALMLFQLACQTARGSGDVENAWESFMYAWSGEYLGIGGDMIEAIDLVNAIANLALA